jgi:nucleotide-binding universal stress UspA family protein
MVELKCILVPLDGSPLSERALPAAMALAKAFESQIILLTALEVSFPTVATYDFDVSARILEAYEHMHEEAERYLAAKEGELREKGFNVRAQLSEASPADSIIDAAIAEEVDLIVMSSHGRGGLARWTFGSVADKVVRHSPCPVMLMRKKPESASSGG